MFFLWHYVATSTVNHERSGLARQSRGLALVTGLLTVTRKPRKPRERRTYKGNENGYRAPRWTRRRLILSKEDCLWSTLVLTCLDSMILDSRLDHSRKRLKEPLQQAGDPNLSPWHPAIRIGQEPANVSATSRKGKSPLRQRVRVSMAYKVSQALHRVSSSFSTERDWF